MQIRIQPQDTKPKEMGVIISTVLRTIFFFSECNSIDFAQCSCIYFSLANLCFIRLPEEESCSCYHKWDLSFYFQTKEGTDFFSKCSQNSLFSPHDASRLTSDPFLAQFLLMIFNHVYLDHKAIYGCLLQSLILYSLS